jgi:ATP-dependent DNA helicase RecG
MASVKKSQIDGTEQPGRASAMTEPFIKHWTLDEVEALREGWDFEAKRAAGRDGGGRLPEDFWPTYSAMANTRGGHIVLGLKQAEDGTLLVQGIRDAQRLERELWDLLQNRQKVSVNLLAEGDVTLQEIEGKWIVVVHVPQATLSVLA